MTDFLAKNFNTRQELEARVSSLMGLTADSKPEHSIVGTGQELKRLFLGHGKIFWGISVVETDLVREAKIVVVERGERFKSRLEDLNINASTEEPPEPFKGIKIKKHKRV